MKYRDNTLLNPNDINGTLQYLWNKSAQQPGLHLTKKAANIRKLELIATVEYPPRNQDEESDEWGLQMQANTEFQSIRKRKSNQILSDDEDSHDSLRMPPPKSISNYPHFIDIFTDFCS